MSPDRPNIRQQNAFRPNSGAFFVANPSPQFIKYLQLVDPKRNSNNKSPRFQKNPMKKYVPLSLLSCALAASVLAPMSVSAQEYIPISQAASTASIKLEPNKGRYLQLPAEMPVYTYTIDDSSVLELGQTFESGHKILRLIGLRPGSTGLGLVVKGADGSPQTLNFNVTVGEGGSNETIHIQGEQVSAPTQFPTQLISSPPSRFNAQDVLNGLKFYRDRIPQGSALYNGVINWVRAVEGGKSEQEAFEQTGIVEETIETLTRVRTIPVVQASAPPPQTEKVSKRAERKERKQKERALKDEAKEQKEKQKIAAKLAKESSAKEQSSKSSSVAALRKRIAELERQVVANSKSLKDNRKLIAQVKQDQGTFLARITDLEKESATFLAQVNQDKELAQASQPKEQAEPAPVQVAQTPEATPAPAVERPKSSVEAEVPSLTPVQLAHALKRGLLKSRSEYPYLSPGYRRVNTAVIKLLRGADLMQAAKASGMSVDALQSLVSISTSNNFQGSSADA